MQKAEYINVRVYGIVINQNKEVLLSDEYLDRPITKFPGGGLEPGESTIETLQREAIEEFGQEIEVLDHYYTTDFFQQAIYRKKYQVIPVYYRMRFKEELKFTVAQKKHDFPEMKNGVQSFRWAKISSLNQDDVTFPTDKKVVSMLKQEFCE